MPEWPQPAGRMGTWNSFCASVGTPECKGGTDGMECADGAAAAVPAGPRHAETVSGKSGSRHHRAQQCIGAAGARLSLAGGKRQRMGPSPAAGTARVTDAPMRQDEGLHRRLRCAQLRWCRCQPNRACCTRVAGGQEPHSTRDRWGRACSVAPTRSPLDSGQIPSRLAGRRRACLPDSALQAKVLLGEFGLDLHGLRPAEARLFRPAGALQHVAQPDQSFGEVRLPFKSLAV